MVRSSDAVFPLSLFRDQSFQLRQIRRVLLLVGLFVLQSTVVLGVFYHILLGRLVAGNAPLLFASEDMGVISDSVPSLTQLLSQWLIVMLVLNALLMVAVSVYISRQLGSPLLAIRRALNDIGDGNLAVRLRVNDQREFGELSDALNRAVEQIHGRINEARALTQVVESLDEQPTPENAQVVRALKDCRDVLSYFDMRSDAVNDANSGLDQSDGASGGSHRARR